MARELEEKQKPTVDIDVIVRKRRTEDELLVRPWFWLTHRYRGLGLDSFASSDHKRKDAEIKTDQARCSSVLGVEQVLRTGAKKRLTECQGPFQNVTSRRVRVLLQKVRKKFEIIGTFLYKFS